MAKPDLSEVKFVKSPASWDENCVEVGLLADGGVAVRNSNDADGPAVVFTGDEWDAFQGAPAGFFNRGNLPV